MLLYAIRHGQSMDNFLRRYSGWSSAPLSDKGREDARRAGQLLRGIHFDKIYASPLARAKETCLIASGEANPIIHDDLKEIDVGELQGILREDAYKRWPERYPAANTNRDYTAWGGEDHDMHTARVIRFMKEMEAEPADETVAVFCHDGTIKAMLSHTLGINIPARQLFLNNGAICVFEYNDGKWILSRWNVIMNEEGKPCVSAQ